MTRIEAHGKPETSLRAEFEVARVSTAIFLAAEAQLFVGWWASQYLLPVDTFGERAHFSGRHAHCVQRAYQSAHARAGDVIDWNAVLLEPLENADMREATRAAA
jgi:hypothetical protein